MKAPLRTLSTARDGGGGDNAVGNDSYAPSHPTKLHPFTAALTAPGYL